MQSNTAYPLLISPSPNIIETFGLAFCHLIDFHENGTECSEDLERCVQCTIQGKYFTGESVNDPHSTGLLLYYTLWVLVMLLAIVGVFANALVIMVLKARKTEGIFEYLLVILAGVDIFCSLSSAFSATGCLAYFGNWLGRGKISLYWYWLSTLGLFGRSCSTLMTVLITVERYLMITFPLQATHWLTPKNTNISISFVLLLAVFLNYPRFASLSVETNNLKDIPSLRSFEFILRSSSQGRFWYGTMSGLTDKVDNWMPLPIILFFNLLSFWKVYQFSKQRQKMNKSLRMNIDAVKMFLPVVVIYFVTNIEPLVNYLIIHFMGIAYREMYMLLFLSITVNSAVNLPIYYFRSRAFKSDTRALIKKLGQGRKLVWEEGRAQGKNEVSISCGTMASTADKLDGDSCVNNETKV